MPDRFRGASGNDVATNVLPEAFTHEAQRRAEHVTQPERDGAGGHMTPLSAQPRQMQETANPARCVGAEEA
jgi:hypothetical protein